MNKTIIITSAFAAGAAALFYWIKRNRKIESAALQPQAHTKPSRHLVNAFSKAKQHTPGSTGNSMHEEAS